MHLHSCRVGNSLCAQEEEGTEQGPEARENKAGCAQLKPFD
jgi:hypothetical protein